VRFLQRKIIERAFSKDSHKKGHASAVTRHKLLFIESEAPTYLRDAQGNFEGNSVHWTNRISWTNLLAELISQGRCGSALFWFGDGQGESGDHHGAI
jgi:hypothetical protein